MQNDSLYFEHPQFIVDDWLIAELLITELSPSKIFVLTDTNTFEKCLPILSNNLNLPYTVITIPQGESNKNLRTAEYIWQFLADHGADRQSILINLGGGVVTDIGAFCADTFMRGIRYIQIPTSILAMTDAALGGKTGIDLGHLKNYIGSFSHTEAIFIHPHFIKTLPREEQINGMGEIIKHSIIEGGQLWALLQTKPPLDKIEWSKLLKLSTRVKIDIANKDPKEKGLRKTLNLGHTFGHAFESYSLQHDKEAMKHGEAVAHGMVCAIMISVYKRNLNRESSLQMIAIIKTYFNIVAFPKNIWVDLYGIMSKDKKNHSGKVNTILLEGIGQATWDNEISYDDFERIMIDL